MSFQGMIIPSKESLIQSARLEHQSEEDIVREYMAHPVMPINQKLRIDKIGIINMDCLTQQKLGKLKYGTFRKLYPEVFFECKDPNSDYTDTDQVAPAVIISGETKYRVNQILWLPLSDIISGIIKKQGKTGKKILPIEVFVDDKDQWMVPLFNCCK